MIPKMFYENLDEYQKLSSNAKKVFEYIYPKIYCFGKITDTNSDIKEHLGLTIDVVKKAIEQLAACNLIERRTTLPIKKGDKYIKNREIYLDRTTFKPQIKHNALTMNEVLENIVFYYNYLKIYLKPEVINEFKNYINEFEILMATKDVKKND